MISTVRTYLKAIAHFEQPPDNLIASTGFAVLSPAKKLDSRFLWRAVQDHDFVGRVVANSEGVGYPAIAPSRLANLPILFPPLTEQRRIAEFLDAQTAKIDRLMNLRRRQMELLQEQRAALIQQAVTRGLNPHAPMCHTGLDWVGEIPAHWRKYKLSKLARRGRGTFTNGPFGSDLLTSELTDSGVPVVYIRDIKATGYRRISEVCVTIEKAAYLDTFRVDAGDIIVAKVGDPPGTGRFTQNQNQVG